MPGLPAPLSAGSLFNYQSLLIGKPKATSFFVEIYDPNQNTKKEYLRPFKKTDVTSLLNSAVKSNLENFRS